MSNLPPGPDPMHPHPHPHHFDPYSWHYHRYRKAFGCRHFGVGRRAFWFLLGGFTAAWWIKTHEMRKNGWKPCTGTKFGIERAHWGGGDAAACGHHPHSHHWKWKSADGTNSADVRFDTEAKPEVKPEVIAVDDRPLKTSKHATGTVHYTVPSIPELMLTYLSFS